MITGSIRKTFKLHSAQSQFRRDQSVYRGFVGGRGAGKSWVGGYDLIRRAKPDSLYMAAAPTYPVMRDATLRTFLDLAKELQVLRAFSRGDMTAILSNGAQVIFRSAEDPDKTMRGPNLSGVWLDEASVMGQLAFDLSIAALREHGVQGWLSATFTPKGTAHWTYRVFGANKPDTALFHASTRQNPFLPATFAETLRGQYASSFAQQEIDGMFVDIGGGFVKRHWFQVVDAVPVGATRVRGWDTASSVKASSDYTVGTLVSQHDGIFYVEHVQRDKVMPSEVEKLMRHTAQSDGVETYVAWEEEGGSSGQIASSSFIRALAGFAVKPIRISGDKLSRAMPFLAQAEAGNVRLVRGAWNEDWLTELTAFPNGEHDDQVDSCSCAFNYLTHGVINPSVGQWDDGRSSAPENIIDNEAAWG